MGGDLPPTEIFHAVLLIAETRPAKDVFVVFGHNIALETARNIYAPKNDSARIEFFETTEVIGTEDSPLFAVRRKKDSSLLKAITMLREGYLDGFVSAGNTGALVAGASLTLPALPGIDRPALLATIPSRRGDVAVLDIGATVSCKAKHLMQFAKMGIAYQKCIKGVNRPTVGLLNIGIEAKKGRSEECLAYEAMQENCFGGEFIGNIEGADVFRGKVDVLVTDGFSGNVFLKTSEGISSFVFESLQGSLPDSQEISDFYRQLNYEERAGAVVCGVDGIIVKCHGYSSQKAIRNGIQGVISLIESKFTNAMKEILQD